MIESDVPPRKCLRDPIPEISLAARLLEDALTAHLAGRFEDADELIRKADMPEIRAWTESLWGAKSPHVNFRTVPDAPTFLPKDSKIGIRMPSTAEKRALLDRDGWHCRFCGIPVIRAEVRSHIHKLYPDALPWGSKNILQHSAFQAMWVQYDHLVPHARGGDNSPDNMVITCAPCNYGRWHHTVEEVGLVHPLTREPVRSSWTGLERFR